MNSIKVPSNLNMQESKDFVSMMEFVNNHINDNEKKNTKYLNKYIGILTIMVHYYIFMFIRNFTINNVELMILFAIFAIIMSFVLISTIANIRYVTKYQTIIMGLLAFIMIIFVALELLVKIIFG